MFKQLFTKHTKNADGNLTDFLYELITDFQKLIKALEVETFEQLWNLIVTDEVERRVLRNTGIFPTEIKEHFIDKWSQFKSPELLLEKLDRYESVRNMAKKKPMTIERSIPISKKRIRHRFELRQKNRNRES
ncbi:hypothetical protein AVEN_202183-1 [Araneus ventricosus]|uniref:Uncharacterized protein n=1 Tax=Araneus ventricosus TaxID=182803 RepID=A0A4Y2X602_ARAVE|nr:hypothetical protein AVEN_202183-1 [Araneus ventricosus]